MVGMKEVKPEDRKALRAMDSLMERIRQEVDLYNLVNPPIDRENKKSFLRGEIDDPEPDYEKNSMELPELRSELERLESIDLEVPSNLERVYDKTLREGRYLIQIAEEFGNRQKVLDASAAMFGSPDERLVKEARRILETLEVEDIQRQKVTAEEFKQGFEQIVEEMEIPWEVKYTESDTLSISSSLREMRVPQDRVYSELEFRRLALHEIAAHALRAENGRRQELGILATGVGGYEKADEGVSLFLEKETGMWTNKLERKYAARVVAVDMLMKDRNFRDTFSELISYGVDEDTAFGVVWRVFAGAGLCKDHVYLEGYLEVKDYVENTGRLRDLFIGKAAVEDAEEGLHEEEFIRKPYYEPFQIFLGLDEETHKAVKQKIESYW